MVVLDLMLRCLVLVVLWSVVGLLMMSVMTMLRWKRRHLLQMREQRLLLGRKTFDRASLLDDRYVTVCCVYDVNIGIEERKEIEYVSGI